jgi:peptide/nickel transport system permease protein
MRTVTSVVRRQSSLGILAMTLLILLAMTAIFAPVLMGAAAERTDVPSALQGPSGAHWLGTDDLGRDNLARVLVATRLSLLLALGATSIGVAVGLALGGLALLRGVGRTITAGINVAVAFPGMLLALFFATIFGVGSLSAMSAVGLAMSPSFARLMYTLGSKVNQLDYVKAAVQLGLTRRRVFRRYVLPNIAEPLIVNATIAAGSALVGLAALSFLGLGVQSPLYDWGLLLDSSLERIYLSPAAALGSGAAICLAGIAFTLAGERMIQHGSHARALAAASPSVGIVQQEPRAGGSAVCVRNLRVAFAERDGSELEVVHGISFTIAPGERVALVGESGSGKTATALAVAGLHLDGANVTADELRVAGFPVVGSPTRVQRRLLKERIGVAFQDAARSFNPALRVGAQVGEADLTGSRRERLARAIVRLGDLKVSAPELRARQYPHQLSGGTLQRAMTAMALAAEPELLIADEPTTALDVTIQALALQTLTAALDRSGAALLFISHDIAVVAQVCDRVLVMQEGRLVEDLPAADLRERATHPYTRSLVDMARRLEGDMAPASASRAPAEGPPPPAVIRSGVEERQSSS